MFLKQSTAAVLSFGPFCSNADGVTLVTSLVSALDHGSTGIKLSKAGGALTIRHATVTATTYDAYGNYLVTLDTTDTNTLGRLRVQFADATTNLPVWAEYEVVTAAVYDAMIGTGDLLTAVADALLDRANGVETGLTPRQMLRLSAAALAGVLSGAATTTITIKGAGVATTRIVATVDSDGNRSALTLTP